jgi:hypothetical protein
VVAAKNATVVRPWGYRDKVETEPNRGASRTGARPPGGSISGDGDQRPAARSRGWGSAAGGSPVKK